MVPSKTRCHKRRLLAVTAITFFGGAIFVARVQSNPVACVWLPGPLSISPQLLGEANGPHPHRIFSPNRKAQFCSEYHIQHRRAGVNTSRNWSPLDRESCLLPSLHRPRLRSRREPKAVRVSAVSTDQLVPCPTCGGFMRLSKTQVFECKQCGLAIRIEGVLKRMDSGE